MTLTTINSHAICVTLSREWPTAPRAPLNGLAPWSLRTCPGLGRPAGWSTLGMLVAGPSVSSGQCQARVKLGLSSIRSPRRPWQASEPREVAECVFGLYLTLDRKVRASIPDRYSPRSDLDGSVGGFVYWEPICRGLNIPLCVDSCQLARAYY